MDFILWKVLTEDYTCFVTEMVQTVCSSLAVYCCCGKWQYKAGGWRGRVDLLRRLGGRAGGHPALGWACREAIWTRETHAEYLARPGFLLWLTHCQAHSAYPHTTKTGLGTFKSWRFTPINKCHFSIQNSHCIFELLLHVALLCRDIRLHNNELSRLICSLKWTEIWPACG